MFNKKKIDYSREWLSTLRIGTSVKLRKRLGLIRKIQKKKYLALCFRTVASSSFRLLALATLHAVPEQNLDDCTQLPLIHLRPMGSRNFLCRKHLAVKSKLVPGR